MGEGPCRARQIPVGGRSRRAARGTVSPRDSPSARRSRPPHNLDRAADAGGPIRRCPGRNRRRAAGVRRRRVVRRGRSRQRQRNRAEDRKSVVEGKRVSVRVTLGGSRDIKKKKQTSRTIR